MTYVIPNYKTKKELKRAVEEGKAVRVFEPGLGSVPQRGKVCLEGPHYPEPHRWYATAEVRDGFIVKGTVK